MTDTRDRAYYKNLKCKDALKRCYDSLLGNYNVLMDKIMEAVKHCSDAHYYCRPEGGGHGCEFALPKCLSVYSQSSGVPLKCGPTGQDDCAPEYLAALHSHGRSISGVALNPELTCYEAAYVCYQVALHGRNHDTFEKLHP